MILELSATHTRLIDRLIHVKARKYSARESTGCFISSETWVMLTWILGCSTVCPILLGLIRKMAEVPG